MAQQIEFSLFDYFADTPESVAEMVATLNEATENDTAGAGRKSYAYDVGSELWGARKHLAALTKFIPEWYAALEQDPSQAFEAISKEALLGEFRAEELRELGFASEVAYAIKLFWDRVSKRPADDVKQREYFVKGITELKRLFADAHTEDLFMETFKEIEQGVFNAYYSQFESRVKKDPSLVEFAFWLSLGDRFVSLFSSFGKGREPGYHKVFDKAFKSLEGKDWNWTERKARSNNKKDSALKWERRVPDEVIRLSKEPSGVERPEDFIEHYGYRGIQFGNWVEDAAGRYHVLCSGNAHADLAALLKLPRKSISFYGALGLAFGARGTGRASAHYEPMPRNVINLTKMNGGGSFCHEWAHALDFNLHALSHGFAKGKPAALSGSKAGDCLPSAVTSAFRRLMERMKKGNGVLRVEVPDEIPFVSRNWKSVVTKRLERFDYDVTKALASLKGSFTISLKTYKEIGFFYCHLVKETGREVPAEFFIPTDFSSFFLDAKARGDYWKRDHELFARAFESWIEDELHERGMTNSYLVCGTRWGGPYPQDEERVAINNAFRAWWAVLLESGILQNEGLWKRG